MAAKKTAAGFEFLVNELKANRGAAYSDLKEKADKQGVTVFPIMFGRAKALLGLVKSANRGKGKAAKAKAPAPTKRGPGRPKGGGESKSARIRELLRSGMSAGEIAKKVGCSVGLVYNVKSTSGKSGGAAMRRGPGRPPKAKRTDGTVVGVLDALRENDRERERLSKAVRQIRAILENTV